MGRLVCVGVALLLGLMEVSAAPMALHPTARGVVEGALDEAIRPGFAALAARAGALDTQVASLCAAPSDATLAAARNGFAGLVAAWSRVELITIGPLAAEHRAERVLFWPDRKGIALKQVQQILASEDPTATEQVSLAEKSVAVQGLGALDFVLAGTAAESLASSDGAYRCAYGHAIANNLAQIAAALSAEWVDAKGISAGLLRPGPERSDYRTSTEVLTELVGLLAHGVELVRDQRLLSFLGRAGEDPKPKSALFWRSGLTLAAIAADFEGLRQFFEAAELPGYLPPESAGIADDVRAQFDRVAAAAAAVTSPIDVALADPAQRAALDEMVSASQRLQSLLGEDLPAALGLSVGFSSLDGD